MLPITPKGVRRYVAYNARRRGLFGGSRLWLAVYLGGRMKAFAGRVTKKGEAPLVYGGSLASGHWAEVVHEKPRPSSREIKGGRKAAKKADRAARRAETDPTRRNVRRAVRAHARAAAANEALGAQRTPVAPMRIDRHHLRRRQRRALRRAGVPSLGPLERLDRKAIREYP